MTMESTRWGRLGAGGLAGALIAGGWFMTNASAGVGTIALTADSGQAVSASGPAPRVTNASTTRSNLLASATVKRASGDLQSAIEALERAAALAPPDTSVLEALAASYAQTAEAPQRTATERRRLIETGLRYADRALAIDAAHIGSLITRSLLLRSLARVASAEPEHTLLIAEANAARERALQASAAAPAVQGLEVPDVSAPPPPPPPPPPGGDHDDIVWTYGSVEYAVSGPLHWIDKVKDARPIYPPMMIKAGISGTVVLEGIIDRTGHVRKIVVVEAPPLLHHTTIDAVRRWQFDPEIAAAVAPGRLQLRVTATFPAAR